MFAIVAQNFHQPSETFIRSHVQNICPKRTVLLSLEDGSTTQLGCPVLSGLRPKLRRSGLAQRIVNGLRYRWWRYIDPSLRGRSAVRTRIFFEQHGVKAVLAEFGQNGCILRKVCKRNNVPLYVHFHGSDATMVKLGSNAQRHYQKLFRDAAGIIAPSHFLANKIKRLGCPEHKIHICSNGINPADFLKTQREHGKIIAISRLVPVKGPLQTIQAFGIVKSKIPEVRLDFVGYGRMMEECINLAKSLSIHDSITFHGSQPAEKVAALLSKASLFVQHSVSTPEGQTEAFGISPLEALASEVPVVATKSGGIIETIVDGETGLLVAEHDVNAMAHAMISLLEDKERAAAMGRAGRARVIERFSHTRNAERLREIIGI